MKKIIFSSLLAIVVVATIAFAEFFPTVIVTGIAGKWTDTRAYTDLAAAITAIGGNERVLIVVGPEAVGTLTIPINVRLKFMSNGSLVVATQLTLQTYDIDAGNREIFSGTGDIDFPVGATVRSTWFADLDEALDVTSDDTLTMVIARAETLTADATVGDNVTLRWESPLIITSGGFNLTGLKKIEAGTYQIFSGAAANDFDFLAGSVVHSSWFQDLNDVIEFTSDENVELTILIDQPETIDFNVTTDIYQTIQVGKGCIISVDGGQTLTIYSPSNIIASPTQQVKDGAGTLAFTAGNGILYPEWFGADGAGDDEPELQECVNAAQAGSRIIFNNDYTISDSLTLTNKTDLAISGAGSITLSGATNTDYIFELSGTLDNITIEDLELIGENNAAYFQTAIGNASGQTISNVTFRNLKIKEINVGISVNANLGGSYDSAVISNNRLSDIVGGAAGQGYGIHSAKASNVHILGNYINSAQRHSIYLANTPAGTHAGIVISNNIIYNHRNVEYIGAYRSALVVARSNGVIVDSNIIRDFYDCAISIEPVTTDALGCENVIISNNMILWPKNGVHAMLIGEQQVPTVYFAKNILITGNYFAIDYDDSQHAAIILLNGQNITISNNKFLAQDISASFHFIDVGHDAYMNGATHLDYVDILNNVFTPKGVLASVIGAYVATELCTTEDANISILNNFGVDIPVWQTAYAQTTPTNTQFIRNQFPGSGNVAPYVDADTTPNVNHVNYLNMFNTGPINITDFDNGQEGQLLVLYARANANTTIVHNGALIILEGGINYNMCDGCTLTLVHRQDLWFEISRSNTS